jgi:Fe-S cluster biogenesis protein NfuA
LILVREQIETALAKLRDALRLDGGDVQLLDVKDGVVKIALRGACAGCPISRLLLKLGILQKLRAMPGGPEVTQVETVDERG